VTVTVYQRKVLSDFGVIEVDESGYVSSFREKPVFDFTVSAGIYVFSKKVLDFIPDGKKYGFDDLMISLLKQKVPVAAYSFDGYWLDIGRVEDYQQANNDLEIIRNLIKTSY
jgi:mannose-1-phosphate guanylyltransferase